MKRAPAEDIVKFLSFSGQSGEAAAAFERFTPRDWNRVVTWMEDAGLAFFFLQRLTDTGKSHLIPESVSSRLQRNFALNATRVDDLSERFRRINNRFDEVGVRYAVLKGFSLVPEFCPAAALRHQADIDYLIAPASLPVARRILIDAGYEPQQSVSAKEFIFVSPGAKPSRSDTQYSPQAGHAVELHTDVWDSEMHGVQQIPQCFTVDQARRQCWNDLAFFAPSNEDTFLLLVLHACRHLFTQWIRMSCLFEIGYFLNRRASDVDLWKALEQRVGDDPVVREFIVVIAELVAQLFAPPLPNLIQEWGVNVRPATRVWINNYARRWAFCELPVHHFSLFPRSKLVLLLQQQYRTQALATASSPAPAKRASLPGVGPFPKRKYLWLPIAGWYKRKRFVRRGIYYALAQARYLWEIPRWRRLNRNWASSPPDGYLPIAKKAG